MVLAARECRTPQHRWLGHAGSAPVVYSSTMMLACYSWRDTVRTGRCGVRVISMPQPDRSVSLAQVGFALSLAACLTALVALASAFGGGFDFGIGGGIVLIAVVTPVAGAGAILARLGRASPRTVG